MKKEGTIKRICEHCGVVFMAHVTTTRYCGSSCNGKAYKKNKREEKLIESRQEFHRKSQEFDLEVLNKKKYLSIKESCAYLGVSRSTLHRHSEIGNIPRVGVGFRVIYRKEDLDYFMEAHLTFK